LWFALAKDEPPCESVAGSNPAFSHLILINFSVQIFIEQTNMLWKPHGYWLAKHRNKIGVFAMIQLNTFYTLPELFALVKNRQERAQNYCIYWRDNAPDPSLTDRLIVAAPSDIDEDDDYKETFPSMVNENGYWHYCSDEIVQDVVDLAISQKPNVTDEELLNCLDYYLKRDTFLDLT
jgi:hypothetical protein